MFEADGSVFEFGNLGRSAGGAEPVQAPQRRSRRVRARLDSPAALAALKAYSRQRSAPQARRQIGGRVLRRPGLAHLGSDPEARLAAGDRHGVRLARRRAQHHVLARSRRARPRSRPCARSASAASPTFVGTMVESLILAAIGGLIGAAATYLFFDGLTTSTLGASFTQVVFSFQLSPRSHRAGRAAGAGGRG